MATREPAVTLQNATVRHGRSTRNTGSASLQHAVLFQLALCCRARSDRHNYAPVYGFASVRGRARTHACMHESAMRICVSRAISFGDRWRGQRWGRGDQVPETARGRRLAHVPANSENYRGGSGTPGGHFAVFFFASETPPNGGKVRGPRLLAS